MHGALAWSVGIGTLVIALACSVPAQAQQTAGPGTGMRTDHGRTGAGGAYHRPGRPGAGHPSLPHPPGWDVPRRPYYPGAFRPVPQYPYGWFQRPYPYHLDYYRMRYGGSYAPYFGNLYGPPVLFYTPPVAWPAGVPYGAGAYYW